jgi:hypothetical protein
MGAIPAALVIVLLLLAAAHAPAAPALSTVTAPAAPSSAVLPAQLLTLEQAMEHLEVVSEHYTQTITGTAEEGSSEATTRAAKNKTRTWQTEVAVKEHGEATLSPAAGELFAARARHPGLIEVGSTLFYWNPEAARHDGGRPWVRVSGAALGSAFPFHRLSPYEQGGAGAYAGLIDLLATALGEVEVAGPVVADGQSTTEFSATVDPEALKKEVPDDVAAKEPGGEGEKPLERIEVFITPSGLPLRVITMPRAGTEGVTTETDVNAVNIPLHIVAPPARRTVSSVWLERHQHQ